MIDSRQVTDTNGIAEAIEYPFYVYELYDESSKKVFYIGKGQFDRAHHHTKESMTKDDFDVTSAKDIKIREIEESGKKVGCRIVQRLKTEDEAFAVEAVLIHWVYGLRGECKDSTLCNLAPGHRSEMVRPKKSAFEKHKIDDQLSFTYSDNADSKAQRRGLKDYCKRVDSFLRKNNLQSYVEKQKAGVYQVVVEMKPYKICLINGTKPEIHLLSNSGSSMRKSDLMDNFEAISDCKVNKSGYVSFPELEKATTGDDALNLIHKIRHILENIM